MLNLIGRILRRFLPSVYVVTTFDGDRVDEQTVYLREPTAWAAYRLACDEASSPPPCFASRGIL